MSGCGGYTDRHPLVRATAAQALRLGPGGSMTVLAGPDPAVLEHVEMAIRSVMVELRLACEGKTCERCIAPEDELTFSVVEIETVPVLLITRREA